MRICCTWNSNLFDGFVDSPCRVVEHETFQAIFQKLRPGYKLPTGKESAGPLLDRVHSELQTTCQEQLPGKTVNMSMDGRSNVHNKPVVCVAVTDGDTYVTDTIDTSGTPHTADNLVVLAGDAIRNAELKYGCRVGSFVTDNAANRAAMRRSLKEDETEDVIPYGYVRIC